MSTKIKGEKNKCFSLWELSLVEKKSICLALCNTGSALKKVCLISTNSHSFLFICLYLVVYSIASVSHNKRVDMGLNVSTSKWQGICFTRLYSDYNSFLHSPMWASLGISFLWYCKCTKKGSPCMMSTNIGEVFLYIILRIETENSFFFITGSVWI